MLVPFCFFVALFWSLFFCSVFVPFLFLSGSVLPSFFYVGSVLVPFWICFYFVLMPFWVHFGPGLTNFGPFVLPVLGPFWTRFGPVLTHFGPALDPFWYRFGPVLVPFGACMGLCWSRIIYIYIFRRPRRTRGGNPQLFRIGHYCAGETAASSDLSLSSPARPGCA